MRIAYITAGAAGMYCGSCLHDNTLAAALLELGEDVVLVPTYTPLRTDEPNVSIPRVFFGGINVYLQEKVPLFRHTPWWFDRPLDHPAILQRLARRAGSVDPKQLGDLTVSMLSGESGHQHKELDKLAHWLTADFRPDIVHLSNSMQIGMARKLRERGGSPIVCQLSGEDLFLEKLQPPHYDRARNSPRTLPRRRRLRCDESLLRRFHGRLSGSRSGPNPRYPARPEPIRPPTAPGSAGGSACDAAHC